MTDEKLSELMTQGRLIAAKTCFKRRKHKIYELNNCFRVESSRGSYFFDKQFLPIYLSKSWKINNLGYVTSKDGELMHRIILGAKDSDYVDHKNGIKTDNRLCNIRICNQSQNGANSKKRKNTSSRFKGVSYRKSRNKFYAHITKNGKTYSLGFFIKEEDAAMAYNKKAIEFFGEYARINIL